MPMIELDDDAKGFLVKGTDSYIGLTLTATVNATFLASWTQTPSGMALEATIPNVLALQATEFDWEQHAAKKAITLLSLHVQRIAFAAILLTAPENAPG